MRFKYIFLITSKILEKMDQWLNFNKPKIKFSNGKKNVSKIYIN